MPSLRISEAFELYRLDYILFRNQSKRAEESNKTTANLLVGFLGDIYIEDLTFVQIRNWKLDLDKTRSSTTVRNYVLCLRVVLRFLGKRECRVVDAESIPIPARVKRAPTFLTEEEVTRLINAAPNIRSKAIISLLYASGMRLAELISLNRDQIVQGRFTIIGKGSKPRLCFIDERAQSLVGAYLDTRSDNNEAMFVTRIGYRRMTHTNIQYTVRNTARLAGISKLVTPHKLRHSFATNFLHNNGNMRHLQVMLGHRSLETTMVYAHVVDNDLQMAYNRFHTINEESSINVLT